MRLRTCITFAALFAVYGSCKTDRRSDVVGSIRQTAQLATTETIIDKIVFGTSDKKLLGMIRLNQARFAAYSTAYITTGIDMNKLKPGDIRVTGERIELQLPAPEVQNFSYPFEKFRIDESITENKLLNKIDIFDQENFYRLAESDIRRNLDYSGIGEATRQKTTILLEGILKSLGYREIYITFRPGLLVPADLENTTVH